MGFVLSIVDPQGAVVGMLSTQPVCSTIAELKMNETGTNAERRYFLKHAVSATHQLRDRSVFDASDSRTLRGPNVGCDLTLLELDRDGVFPVEPHEFPDLRNSFPDPGMRIPYYSRQGIGP